MKTNATQRSLKYLRDQGWFCHVVEKFLPARGTMKFPRRIDAFGIGDILACRSVKFHDGNGIPVYVEDSKAIALVQCCPGASHAEHKEKILAIPELAIWKAAGGIVLLHSWSKKGPRGKLKHWTLREEKL